MTTTDDTTDDYFDAAVEDRKILENSTYDNSNYEYDVSTDIADIAVIY